MSCVGSLVGCSRALAPQCILILISLLPKVDAPPHFYVCDWSGYGSHRDLGEGHPLLLCALSTHAHTICCGCYQGHPRHMALNRLCFSNSVFLGSFSGVSSTNGFRVDHAFD